MRRRGLPWPYENQQHRASGLNLLVTAIILWNTRYLERAVATVCQTEAVPDHLLAHLSPLGWEHVNLTGGYIWGAEQRASETSDGLRQLRAPPTPFRPPHDVPAPSPYTYKTHRPLVLAEGIPAMEQIQLLKTERRRGYRTFVLNQVSIAGVVEAGGGVVSGLFDEP